jgi:predicted dehydrogenase
MYQFLSIYWIPSQLRLAHQACFLQPDVEDVVFMNLWFSNNVMANIHLSWLDPNKVRKVTVVGSQKMALYDDVDSEAPIKLYDRGVLNQKDYVSFGEYQFKLRFGDVHIPYIERKEPLKIECEHFLEAIQGKVKPLTDVHDGLRVVRVLEAAQRSLKNGTTVEKVNEHHV